MYRGGGDDFFGPADDIVLSHEEWGIDFGAGVAAVLGDVAMGATPDDAHRRIRLLMLANDVSLRKLEGLQSRPATAFAPVTLTPDELGDSWRGGARFGVTPSLQQIGGVGSARGRMPHQGRRQANEKANRSGKPCKSAFVHVKLSTGINRVPI
jgi:hypothetical protein